MQDPRDYGSRNPGATNILRTGNKILAAIILLIDILKGLAPTLIAYYIFENIKRIRNIYRSKLSSFMIKIKFT